MAKTPLAPGYHFAGQPGLKKVTRKQVRQTARRYHLPARAMVQIVHGESGFKRNIQQRDPGDRNVGYGATQLTPHAWGKPARKYLKKLGGPKAMSDLDKNMAMAAFLYKAAGNSLSPWKGSKSLKGKHPSEGKPARLHPGKAPKPGKGKDKAGKPPKPLPFGQQPILPGSSMTNKQLERDARAATLTQYGPQQAQEQRALANTKQYGRDVSGFYQNYLAQLAQHQADVSMIQAGAQQQLGQTAAGITGLSGQEGAALQAQANQAAQQQGTTQAGNLQRDASNAAATRQALMGSFQNQQTLEGAAAQGQASNLAHVVGPQQAMGAGARAQRKTGQARQDLVKLAGLQGAYKQKYKADTRETEAKNVTALEIATNKTAEQLAEAKIKADQDAADRRAKAREQKANRGVTKRGQNVTRAGQRTTARTAAATRAETRRHNHAMEANDGNTAADRRARTAETARHNQAMERLRGKSGGGGGGTGRGGSDWQTGAQQGSAAAQASQLQGLAGKAKAGQPWIAGHNPQAKLGRGGAANKLRDNYGGDIKDPALLSAALDAVYNGRISKTTARRLRSSGIRPKRVAAALGVGIGAGSTRPASRTVRRNTSAYGRSVPQPQGHA
jgi:hypothetical protein